MPFPYFLVHTGVQYSGLIIIVWILELLPPKVNESLWSERLKRLAQTTRVTTFLDQFLVCGMDTLFHASQKHPLKSLQCPRTHVVLIIPRRDKLILLACLVPRPQSSQDGQNEGRKLRRVQWFLLALLFGVPELAQSDQRTADCLGLPGYQWRPALSCQPANRCHERLVLRRILTGSYPHVFCSSCRCLLHWDITGKIFHEQTRLKTQDLDTGLYTFLSLIHLLNQGKFVDVTIRDYPRCIRHAHRFFIPFPEADLLMCQLQPHSTPSGREAWCSTLASSLLLCTHTLHVTGKHHRCRHTTCSYCQCLAVLLSHSECFRALRPGQVVL